MYPDNLGQMDSNTKRLLAGMEMLVSRRRERDLNMSLLMHEGGAEGTYHTMPDTQR
jgi:hypothetical protein